MSVQAAAPAKINLTLQVGRPRADGLHPLQSVVAFASEADRVSAAPATALSLTITGPFAGALADEPDNLVLRAARALGNAAGVSAGATLTLEKHLPIASGIGGGSSDAAAALKVCNELWGLDWSEAHLAALARNLGADIPVCIGARASYMSGAGEIFAPVALPRLDAVLVNPGVPLATADVYRHFDLMELGVAFASAPAPVWGDREAVFGAVREIGNDLMAPAQALAPIIAEAAQLLSANSPARAVSLSGSGATLFALVENKGDAHALEVDLRTRRPNWWIKAVTLA